MTVRQAFDLSPMLENCEPLAPAIILGETHVTQRGFVEDPSRNIGFSAASNLEPPTQFTYPPGIPQRIYNFLFSNSNSVTGLLSPDDRFMEIRKLCVCVYETGCTAIQ